MTTVIAKHAPGLRGPASVMKQSHPYHKVIAKHVPALSKALVLKQSHPYNKVIAKHAPGIEQSPRAKAISFSYRRCGLQPWQTKENIMRTTIKSIIAFQLFM